ncbi:MAG: lipopolysaccharide biosynthesis protein [Betaproteobacteria bacterium]|nr:MAG: lipopolysaccharide biosynthesis protein [Betaproteobacteria bacterium]
MNPVENAQSGAGDESISLLDVAVLVAENWKLLVMLPLAAGFVALGVSYLIQPTYTASTRILSPQQQQSGAAALATQLGALAGFVGGSYGAKSPADQYVALMKSRAVLDPIIERFKLRELYKSPLLAETRTKLERNVRISVGAKDGIISIEVDDQDPVRSAELANALVAGLRDLTNSLAVTEAAQRRLFFDEQLKLAKDNLARAEIALRGSGVSEAALKTVPQTALEALARLKAQITAQEVKLNSMRVYMTDANPELRRAASELAALRSELVKAEQTTANKDAGGGAEYISKYRDFKYYETLFDLMAKQYELARLDEAREGTVIQVVDPAQTPEQRSKPRRAQIAVLTTLIGAFLVFLWVLARQAFVNAAQVPGAAPKVQRIRRLFRFRT